MSKYKPKAPRWLDEIEEVVSEEHDLTSDIPTTVEVVRGPNRACILIFFLLLIGVGAALFIFAQWI
jgi:hypothetical protein